MIGFPRLAGLEADQITQLLEPGRTIGAFVDNQLVGTADAVTSTLTLPGGARVGHAAVTHIGVLPSFTRRGIASDLVRHQLHDAAARGEEVATLRASEATIYERYGYGAASCSHSVEVQAARATLRPGVATGGTVRLLDPAQVWDMLPRIYADNRPTRPGTIDRPDVWWHSMRLRTESAPGPWYVAVHGAAGSETGFARYRPIDTDKWFVSDQRTNRRGGLLRPRHRVLPRAAAIPPRPGPDRSGGVLDAPGRRSTAVAVARSAGGEADRHPRRNMAENRERRKDFDSTAIRGRWGRGHRRRGCPPAGEFRNRVHQRRRRRTHRPTPAALRRGGGAAAVLLGGARGAASRQQGWPASTTRPTWPRADRLFAVQQAPHAGFFF